MYNSTVENTKPPNDDVNFDLFTWGINRSVALCVLAPSSHQLIKSYQFFSIRNAALGQGDANDRTHPELVNVPRGKYEERRTGSAKFYPLQVRGVGMSKLHTGTCHHSSEQG